LYWHYLDKHADVLAKNPRMLMQLKNLNRLSAEQRGAIAVQAQALGVSSDDAALQAKSS
jgi:deoxyribodipyrimidine photolyase-related protein